jgi:hypothetical protein
MTTEGALERGRESFARQAWGEAFAELTAADHDEPLAAEDLERLGMVAALIGKDEESDDIRTRAHHEYLRMGDSSGAARVAFWLAMALFNRGEHARGGGWIARVQRVLEESQQECVERAYPLIPMALQSLEQGDVQDASAAFEEAGKLGERFRDPNLLTMSRLGLGSALIVGGQLADGMSLLDEVMVMVTTEGVSPIVVGIAYCAVIDVCESVFDVRRAQEWTTALDRWCRAQPDLVPFRGQCLVHRATLMQLHGS